jgi:hypothetical protein
MKDESSITPSPDTDGSDSDVVSLLQDLKRQVLSLERKIDLLSGQMQERPRRESPPDRPFRKRAFYGSAGTSERPHRHGGGERHGPKKGAAAREPFYEKRPHGRKPGPGKKRFPNKRRDRE